MVLSFDFRCVIVSMVFLLLVVGFACLTAWRYLKKTNIIEVIRKEHINEPVKELGRWCGPVGAVVLMIGAVMGYGAPSICHIWFHTFPPSWVNIFYAPVFVGLYMIMLHTVVYGWKSYRKNPYKNIISRSMMKFQGKQTVNNLIIVTLLIAGGCFAIFYIPINAVSAMINYAGLPYDYFYKYRADQDETSLYSNNSARELTNIVTRKQLDVEFAGFLHYDLLTDSQGCSVIKNEDYAMISEGLTDNWMGRMVRFNVDGKDSYRFADELYDLYVDCFDESCEYPIFYDRVQKIRENEAGEVYWEDTDSMTKISYEQSDSFAFRTWWTYQPGFRILNQNDFLRSMTVMLMMFLFIFIVCLITALVVCYTRCQTIVLNNRYIFDDLKKLGASPDFLYREVRSQCNNVFKIPSLVGMFAMYLLFMMILYANDGRILFSE